MRFQFTATVKPGYDAEKFDVTFSAPTWADAVTWAHVFLRQIGLKQSDLEAGWQITYGAKTEAELLKRARQREITQ
jgi:hypothetical protein